MASCYARTRVQSKDFCFILFCRFPCPWLHFNKNQKLIVNHLYSIIYCLLFIFCFGYRGCVWNCTIPFWKSTLFHTITHQVDWFFFIPFFHSNFNANKNVYTINSIHTRTHARTKFDVEFTNFCKKLTLNFSFVFPNFSLHWFVIYFGVVVYLFGCACKWMCEYVSVCLYACVCAGIITMRWIQ